MNDKTLYVIFILVALISNLIFDRFGSTVRKNCSASFWLPAIISPSSLLIVDDFNSLRRQFSLSL